jgi:hypothetical protein
MGFFHGGLGDRPRRAADDNNDRTCQTPGCGRWVETGVTFCWECALQRIRWAVFEEDAHAPTARMRVQERAHATEELIREQSAPLLAEAGGSNDALDDACPWCRRIKAELGLALQLSSGDVVNWRGVCAAHRTRGRAFIEIRGLLDEMLIQDHLPSESIAAYYAHGYLGPLLEALEDFD